ncbi:MAG TPA: hypothetical protein VK790_06805 [Solirubrobacteraceae bacterium]|jgi:hypothetical protein|nr:hypothetical protein [Solirubrobacteraceae bacterium]
MPTATTSSNSPKARAKAASKPAAAKAAPAKRASTRGATQAKATHAERAVLIPVGAALIARERVVSTVSDTISTYGSTTKTQAQLRRFERRGVTARSRLEREVRKARVRVERQLRQRRRTIESTVSELEERRDAVVKSSSDLAGRVPELAGKVQERILSLV